jgi:hypothetical protein
MKRISVGLTTVLAQYFPLFKKTVTTEKYAWA